MHRISFNTLLIITGLFTNSYLQAVGGRQVVPATSQEHDLDMIFTTIAKSPSEDTDAKKDCLFIAASSLYEEAKRPDPAPFNDIIAKMNAHLEMDSAAYVRVINHAFSYAVRDSCICPDPKLITAIQRFLNLGGNPRSLYCDNPGDSLVDIVVESGPIACMELFIHADPTIVHAPDSTYGTSVHAAIIRQNPALLTLLLSYNANPHKEVTLINPRLKLNGSYTPQSLIETLLTSDTNPEHTSKYQAMLAILATH